MATFRYPINWPSAARPRGLGYASIGHTLSGLGSWVVDTQYGLGDRVKGGLNRMFPAEAHPTNYPRAFAARVLGTSNAPAVGRPFAATRLPTMAHPVRMTPVIAPGAVLRNPGVSGIAESLSAMAAVTQSNVMVPAAVGLAVGVGGQVAGLTGAVRNVTGIAALGALAWAAWRAYQNWKDLNPEEVGGVGPAASGARVGESVAATAVAVTQKVAAGGAMTDSERRQILASFSCYENASRARANEGWWAKLMGGTVRNPLADCGLTAAQRDAMLAAFNAIPKIDRVRLMPSTFGPGGALEDLGR